MKPTFGEGSKHLLSVKALRHFLFHSHLSAGQLCGVSAFWPSVHCTLLMRLPSHLLSSHENLSVLWPESCPDSLDRGLRLQKIGCSVDTSKTSLTMNKNRSPHTKSHNSIESPESLIVTCYCQSTATLILSKGLYVLIRPLGDIKSQCTRHRDTK